MESTGKPRKRARGTLNAHQRKKPKKGYTPGNDLAAFLIRKALYLPQFLDSNGEPYEIFKDAPIAQYISIMMTGPAREFFDYRMGTSSVNYESPRYPKLFDYVERFSGERGSSFALLKEVETNSGKSWYQRTNVMGWGGANASIFMETNLGIDEDMLQRGLLYASGFNDKVISDVIETLEVQYKVYYNLYGELIKANEGIPVNIPPFKPIYPTFEFDGVRYNALDPKLHIYTLVKGIINIDVFAQGYGDFLTRMERMREAESTGMQMPEGRTKLINWEIDRTQSQELRQLVDMASQEVGFPVGLSMNMESSIIKEGIRLQRTEPTRDAVDLGPTVSYDVPLEQRIRLAWTRNKADLMPFISLFQAFADNAEFQKATVGSKPRRLARDQQTIFSVIVSETEKFLALKRKDGFQGRFVAQEVNNLVPYIDENVLNVEYGPFQFDLSIWGNVTKQGAFILVEKKNLQQIADGISEYAFDYGCKQALLKYNESRVALIAVYYAQLIGYPATKFIDITWKQRVYGVEFQVGGSKDFDILMRIASEVKEKPKKQETVQKDTMSDAEYLKMQTEEASNGVDMLSGYLKSFMGYLTSSRDVVGKGYRTSIMTYLVSAIALEMSVEDSKWIPYLNAQKSNMPLVIPWTPKTMSEDEVYAALVKLKNKSGKSQPLASEITPLLQKYYSDSTNKKFLVLLDTLAPELTLLFDLRMEPCNIMFQPNSTVAKSFSAQLKDLGERKTDGECTIKQAASKLFGYESFLQIIADCTINTKTPEAEIPAFERFRGQRFQKYGETTSEKLRLKPFIEYVRSNDQLKHVIFAFMEYCEKAFTTDDEYNQFLRHTFGTDFLVEFKGLWQTMEQYYKDEGFNRRLMEDFSLLNPYVFLEKKKENQTFTDKVTQALSVKSTAYWEFLANNALAMNIAKRKDIEYNQAFPISLPKEVQEVLNYEVFEELVKSGRLEYSFSWPARPKKNMSDPSIYDIKPNLVITLSQDVKDSLRTYITSKMSESHNDKIVYSDYTHILVELPVTRDYGIDKDNSEAQTQNGQGLSQTQRDKILKDLGAYKTEATRKSILVGLKESDDMIMLQKQLRKLGTFRQTGPIKAKIKQLQNALQKAKSVRQATLEQKFDDSKIAYVMPMLYGLYVKALAKALIIPNVIDEMDDALNTFNQEKIDKARGQLSSGKKVALPIVAKQVLIDT